MRKLLQILTLAACAGLTLASSEVRADPAQPPVAAAAGGSEAVSDRGYVTLGGIPQWVTVQGRHRGAPLLVILHGGPGYTLTPISYRYMKDWEEYFTVVQWDQRGAGKTYAKTDPAVVRPTLTVGRMVDDAEELVAYLRRTYGVDRVVVLGHSFGTILGVELAERRPEWLYAYVGMGQFVNFQRNERQSYEETLAAARRDGNAEAVKALEAIAPFPDAAHPARNFQNLQVERRWLQAYGGVYKSAATPSIEAAVERASPDATAEDLKLRREAEGFSAGALWAELGGVDLTTHNHFRTPIVILQGRADRGTSATLLDAWFKTVQAPSKQLIWFDDSAHMVFEEEPGKTLVTLVDQVLPLTRPR